MLREFTLALRPKSVTKPLHAVTALRDDDTGESDYEHHCLCGRWSLDELALDDEVTDWEDSDPTMRCGTCSTLYKGGTVTKVRLP